MDETDFEARRPTLLQRLLRRALLLTTLGLIAVGVVLWWAPPAVGIYRFKPACCQCAHDGLFELASGVCVVLPESVYVHRCGTGAWSKVATLSRGKETTLELIPPDGLRHQLPGTDRKSVGCVVQPHVFLVHPRHLPDGYTPEYAEIMIRDHKLNVILLTPVVLFLYAFAALLAWTARTMDSAEPGAATGSPGL